MCNIWKIPTQVPELSADEWLDLLSDDLFADLRELDITGGEPFLRKDLLDERAFPLILAFFNKEILSWHEKPAFW